MPYPNFGFNPYPAYPQQPPVYGVPQQQANNVQNQMNQYAFVNGVEGAKSFIMQPNQTVLLMDSENPVCYMKQSNGLGQSTLRYFKLTEITEQDVRNNASKGDKVINNDYVLRSDYDALLKRVGDLEAKLLKAE